MELPSKLLEQISYDTRTENEKHILIVMDKSSHLVTKNTFLDHHKLTINNLKMQLRS